MIAQAFPYLLAASAGAYLAGATAVLFGTWRTPVRLNPWLVVGTLVAFVVDRAYKDPSLATVAATLSFVGAAFVIARVVGSPRTRDPHALLWRIFAVMPFLFMLLVTSADRFPPADADAMRSAAAGMLALPGLAALGYLMSREMPLP